MNGYELRLPLTKDSTLFSKARGLGERLIWLHTFGTRMVPRDQRLGRVPQGLARCTQAVPATVSAYPESFEYVDESRSLRVGAGVFEPVSKEVFEFGVSGLKVVQSWLKYRMRQGAGKKSSPLDNIRPERWTSQFTTELLEILWVLEATLATYPEQSALLDAIVKGECFLADELPPVTDEMRKPPREKASTDTFDFGADPN